MHPPRIPLALVLAALLSACAAAEPAPQPAPGLLGVPVEAPPEPESDPEPVEPEPSLQERWRAPFGVVSRGRPAPRPERVVVVRAGSERRAAAAEPVPVAAAAAPSPPARPAAAPARPAEAEARTHKVEWGETWYGIARRYGVAPAALEAANPSADPGRIRSGQVLRIPAAGARAAEGQRTHRVAGGDSLWGIARRYGVTMEQIRAANRLQGDRVRIGQTLIIPSAGEGR